MVHQQNIPHQIIVLVTNQSSYYRPQMKFVKVIFLQVCVCPQGGGIQACLAGFQAQTQGGSLGGSDWGVSRHTPKGEVEGDLVQVHTQGEVEGDLARGCLLWGCLLWGVPALGGACSGEGACSKGVPALGGACSRGCGDPPTNDGYCCGRYASYWNAFLFHKVFSLCWFEISLFIMLLLNSIFTFKEKSIMTI